MPLAAELGVVVRPDPGVLPDPDVLLDPGVLVLELGVLVLGLGVLDNLRGPTGFGNLKRSVELQGASLLSLEDWWQ